MARAIIAFVVVAVIIGAVAVAAFTQAVPDVNDPTGDNGETSVGYMDVRITSHFGTQGTNFIVGDVTKIEVDEHVTSPSGPVTTIFLPGLTADSCTSYMRLFVDGVGIASTSQKSESRSFSPAGGDVTFSFGHIHVFAIGATYSLSAEVYVRGCSTYDEWTLTDVHAFTITFDGQ
jgi:opacity protein-like surface antigen